MTSANRKSHHSRMRVALCRFFHGGKEQDVEAAGFGGVCVVVRCSACGILWLHWNVGGSGRPAPISEECLARGIAKGLYTELSGLRAAGLKAVMR